MPRLWPQGENHDIHKTQMNSHLNLPVMHQFLNVEGIRKYHGIAMTDQEWDDFMEDYEADICDVWREVFLQFLRERPPIKQLFYPACCAPRNAGHPEYAGHPDNDSVVPVDIMESEEDFLKEIQGLEEGE